MNRTEGSKGWKGRGEGCGGALSQRDAGGEAWQGRGGTREARCWALQSVSEVCNDACL